MFGSGLDIVALLAWLTIVALVVVGTILMARFVITTLRQRHLPKGPAGERRTDSAT
ncbi:hypothetical protein JM654_15965 [Microbacterium oxydans]|nr:hypothetical protein [Microbacterium oxydans]